MWCVCMWCACVCVCVCLYVCLCSVVAVLTCKCTYLVNVWFVEFPKVHKSMCGLTKLCIRRSNTKHLCTPGLQETLHSRQTKFINSKDYLNTYVHMYGETLLDTVNTYACIYACMYCIYKCRHVHAI